MVHKMSPYVCTCMCAHACTSAAACVEIREQLERQFFPSTMCNPGIEFRPSGQAAGAFHLDHLAGPMSWLLLHF